MFNENELKAIFKDRTFSLYTLGCKVNQEEGEAIANLLSELGMQRLPFGEAADVCIINTCTVTGTADQKSRQHIRKAARQNPDSIIVATGCYAQISPEQAAAEDGVVLVVGTNDRPQLPALLAEALSAPKEYAEIKVSPTEEAYTYAEIGNHHAGGRRERAYIKIEDGCSQFCSYCIIPYARGPVKSRPVEAVIAEAESLIVAGYPEIVLTGIHTGAYGTDLSGAPDLAGLAAKLAALPGMKRLHLGSIEPLEVTDDLLKLMQENTNVCRHLHIPLQAPCDNTIKRMNRHYTTAMYRELVQKIREKLPDCVITTDIIVGFPSETAEEFAQGLDFLREVAFADMHIFPYSVRPGTPAAAMPQVPAAEKKRRAAETAKVKAELKQLAFDAWQGKKLSLLLEQQQNLQGKPHWVGHSSNYLPVGIIDDGSKNRGEIVEVEVCGQQGDWLLAKPV